jgi:hypothetical protein
MSDRKPMVQAAIGALIREQGVAITSVHAIKAANLVLLLLNNGIPAPTPLRTIPNIRHIP